MSELIAMAQVSDEIAGVFETRDMGYGNGWTDPMFSSSNTIGVRTMWQALENPAVWKGVKLLSSDVAKLPVNIRKRSGETASEVAPNHPAQQLVRWQSNRGDENAWIAQTSFQFWQTMMQSALIFNNAYAWIKRDGTGKPLGLYPLLPDATMVLENPGQPTVYMSSIDSGTMYLMDSEVLHLQSLRYRNGDIFTLRQAAHSWGVGLAAEDFTGKFFTNGESGTGILTIPLGMRPETAERTVAGFKKAQTGRHNAFKTIPLFDGVDYKRLGSTNRDAQLDALRNLQGEDVARWLSLPPHKLGYGVRQSYSSVEQENRDYLLSSLSEHLNVIAAECYLKLLTQQERDARSHDVKHDTSELTQGDNQTQVDTGVKGVAGGLFTTNEWREQRNTPPAKGGDVLRVPLNTAPVGEVDEDDEEVDDLTTAAESDDDPDEDAARSLARQTLLDHVRPLFGRIRTEAKRKTLKKFSEWAIKHSTAQSEELEKRFSMLAKVGVNVPDSMLPKTLNRQLMDIFNESAKETAANESLFADTVADKLRTYEESI